MSYRGRRTLTLKRVTDRGGEGALNQAFPREALAKTGETRKSGVRAHSGSAQSFPLPHTHTHTHPSWASTAIPGDATEPLPHSIQALFGNNVCEAVTSSV